MKNNKLPSLISILILTLLTTVMWISFSIYRAVTTQPPVSVDANISKPLNPNLDKDTINKIESSLFLDSSQLPQSIVVEASSLPAATPIATFVPTATVVASPSATPATP